MAADRPESHTADEIIQSQLQLEADAREALPYQFDVCTSSLGPLRQQLFSCLTCNPPPASAADPYPAAAGVCYSCSISCHGSHELIELFNKRDFLCDCGTTRFANGAPCALRRETAAPARAANRYMKNFRNLFCGCNTPYDPDAERGVMYQCIGLEGGCGEDWWHPECIVGLPRDWYKAGAAAAAAAATAAAEAAPVTVPETASRPAPEPASQSAAGTSPRQAGSTLLTEANLRKSTATTTTAAAAAAAAPAAPEPPAAVDESDHPVPPGFPDEDDFESFICYQCVAANPWIKRYGSAGGNFLPPVYHGPALTTTTTTTEELPPAKRRRSSNPVPLQELPHTNAATGPKRAKLADPPATGPTTEPAPAPASASAPANGTGPCRYTPLPAAPAGTFSLFLREGFRDQFCRCERCLAKLVLNPGLREEEETYEPPVSEAGSAGAAGGGGGSIGSGSMYERGEAALNTLDGVTAIEGVLAYNDLKSKLKTFLAPFAESGQAVSAEDIKSYFARLRGERDLRPDPFAPDNGGAGDENHFRRPGRGY